MTFPSIRIEGTIVSGELLSKLDSTDTLGQRHGDFGFDSQSKLKDEIVRAWTAGQAFYKAFQHKLEGVKEGTAATSETRNQWIIPLLGLLGYAELEFQAQAELVGDKPFRISHRLRSHGGFAINIVGARESLDRKPEAGAGPRVSPHAHVQEYLNLTEHLYAVVTNGRLLRLLRDSTRLVRLSYVEFDLDRMFGEDLFADFAIFYRLLHVSRLPKASESPESLLEHYHQDSLASGERIRDGLSGAVKQSILLFADGFLNHPQSDALRQLAASDPEFAAHLYQKLLRLVYRLLFLMVIEERDLVYAEAADTRKRNLYYAHYSLARLRRIAEKRHLADGRHHDCWDALRSTFRLFDETAAGRPLGIEPLGGDLFDSGALGPLGNATLDNETLLACLRNLSLFRNFDTGQLMRVNYAALNVEEFGSVYQGLLEFEPQVTHSSNRWQFAFAKGDERSRTGSHYTPDELVQPLIKHSLDYLIADKLKEKDKEKALLSLRVVDVACGSGHILLAAARRIGTELAILRTGDDQPSPAAFREAVRDVIRHCIYGMDLNPLAVELCKVALWLEAHVPGWPLSFLDHRIHCGNAIVGLAHRAELQRGIPDEAFKTLPGDDKDLAAALRKQNKEERSGQKALDFAGRVEDDIRALDDEWKKFDRMPERSAADYYTRRTEYEKFRDNIRLRNLSLLADAQVAQFYLPKTPENRGKHVTHDTFSRWMEGLNPTGPGIAAAMALAQRKRFGHWFIEFWDVVDAGGFDLIIGNPPYLGGQALSGSYGHAFCEWVKWEYAPTGLSELVVFFLRRIYDLLRPGGFVALITTNSIKDGDVRTDGLEEVMKKGGNLTFAVNGIIWPGVANLYVSLFSLHKGQWENKPRMLDGRQVPFISAFFEDYADAGSPSPLKENEDRIFQGSVFLGDGFLLSHEEAREMKEREQRLSEVVFEVINGQELNNHPEQRPGRQIINFFDWSLERAETYELAIERVRRLVKPVRDQDNRAVRRERWWQFAEKAIGLYSRIRGTPRCFSTARTTKHLNYSAQPTTHILTDATYTLTSSSWSDYAVVQSTLHEVWARKYSGALKKDLRYSPTDCFLTFAFPRDPVHETALAAIGETYHEHRRSLMRDLWLGLTDLYNLFHDPDLTPALVTESLGERATINGDEGFTRLLRLRDLHRELDQTVLTAYGWHAQSDFGPALALRHDFHPLDFLPENDRIRFTLHPESRREVLTRLLKLNHQRAAQAEQVQQQAAIAAPAKRKSKPKQPAVAAPPELALGLDLFGRPAIPASVERNLPSGRRTTLGGQLYPVQLVRALLAEAGGSIAWPRLVDAFTLATQPALMQQHTKSADAARVTAWSTRWNESPPPGSLLTAIETLGAGNLKADRYDDTWMISLRGSPAQSSAEDVTYDAWLALHVLGPATSVALKTPTLVIAEFDDWTKRMEAQLVA